MGAKRAPVQGENTHHPNGQRKLGKLRGLGTIAWSEHLEAFKSYASEYGDGQSAERIAERGGFSYDELALYLGREPSTWLEVK